MKLMALCLFRPAKEVLAEGGAAHKPGFAYTNLGTALITI